MRWCGPCPLRVVAEMTGQFPAGIDPNMVAPILLFLTHKSALPGPSISSEELALPVLYAVHSPSLTNLLCQVPSVSSEELVLHICTLYIVPSAVTATTVTAFFCPLT